MTACRHHVPEQGLGPRTNGVYAWWPLLVISGLAQASYTVQRSEAEATKKTKTTKQQRDLATCLPSAMFGQIFGFVFCCCLFLCVFLLVCLVFLVSLFLFLCFDCLFVCLASLFSFRKVSELFGNVDLS